MAMEIACSSRRHVWGRAPGQSRPCVVRWALGAMGRGKKWMEIILDLVGDIPSLSSALSSWLGQPLAEVVVDYQTQEEP